ncbi:MAG TPA: CcmD family protein [Ktedonobacterales bacterium]
MQGGTFLVLAYIAIWLGTLAYVGWLALRQRGIAIEVEDVRRLAERQHNADGSAEQPASSK